MLHVQYGLRTQDRERQAFVAIADRLNARHRLITNIGHLAAIGGSSLTDRNMPVTEPDIDSTEIPTSYVPFRNAHLLAIAVSWAEVIGATRIYFGAVEEDSSGYPDCRQAFVDDFNRLVETGTKPDTHIKVYTPLIDKSKEAIVRLGLELGAPLELSWSCYRREREACGHCDSCALRLRGFHRAGAEDPIRYEDNAHRHRYT